MISAADERQARTVEQVMRRRAEEDFAGAREGRNARRGMDGKPTSLTTGDRDLAGVQPGRHPDVQLADCGNHRARAPGGTRRAVKQGQEPVPGSHENRATEVSSRLMTSTWPNGKVRTRSGADMLFRCRRGMHASSLNDARSGG
jgi:hypothetical protein